MYVLESSRAEYTRYKRHFCRGPEYDVVGRPRNAVATSVPQL